MIQMTVGGNVRDTRQCANKQFCSSLEDHP